MTRKSRKTDIRTVRARERLIKAMRDDGMRLTRHEACDLLFIQKDGHNIHIRALHGERLIHICEWRIVPEKQPVAVFAWGSAPDATRPPKKTRAEIIKENRIRRTARIGDKAWSAIRSAQYHGASVLVKDGLTVWRKGRINVDAARAAFAQ